MRFATHDGPGIRTAVFFKGCPLACWWCHNPESQGFRPDILYFADRCRNCGDCVEACPQHAIERTGTGVCTNGLCTRCGTCAGSCVAEARQIAGRQIGVQELVSEIERDLIFFEDSGGGVTLTGGEPASQPRFAEAVARACKERGIHVVMETCGYSPAPVFLRVASAADAVLFDLKLMDPARHREYTGVSNRPILRNFEALMERGHPVKVRIPVVPATNDTEDEVGRFADYLGRFRGTRVELLPYHGIGAGKYERLGWKYKLPETPAPAAADLARFRRALENAGMIVEIGG